MSANNKEGQDKQKKLQTSKREQTLAPNAAKKKKDEENAKDAAMIISNQPLKYEWTQTNKTVTINLQVEGIADRLDDLDVQFTDIEVNVVLPDERRWSCTFYDLTDGNESRVEVRSTCISLRVTKTSPRLWPTLHASENICADEEMTSQELMIDLPDDDSDLRPSEEKQEELTFLNHIKNDWIEKTENQSFQLRIYVNNTYKDTVDVLFEPQQINIKFQTEDVKFQALHPGTNDSTTFCWKIPIRHEIVPASCKYRVLSNMIEVTLAKKEKIKWGALEKPHTKDSTPSTSDSWQPVCKVSTKSATTGSSEACHSNVVFDELSNVKAAAKVVPPLQSNKENVSQKPTCKVSPMNKSVQQLEMVVSPGTTGLDNLGNTCFMNSILQALANTREFRDYFLDASFQKEINVDNPLGMGGKLAVSFAILLKVLWSGKHYSYAPSKLRNLVAMKASRFTGFAQHDAQEFMAFLLDGLHEDLNRVKNKPYSPTVDSNGRPNEIVANEAWARHRLRDDSFVVDLFHGQFKSKLVCPDCGKVSITFDPFLYLPLPLPKKQRVINIMFLWKDPYKKPVRFIIRLSLESSFEKLKDAIFYKTGVNARDIRVFQAYKGKIYKMYSRGSDISSVQPTDMIIACEVLSKEVAGENVYEVTVIQRTLMPTQFPHLCSACKKKCPEGAKLKRCTQCYKVGYCDQPCQKAHWLQHKPHCRQQPEPVGCPFIISLPESRASFSRLCQLMEAYARYSVDVFQPPVKDSSPTRFGNQTSNSNLSSSSQSSGSLNSLDSQSSCSSSCTITAEPEQQDIADIDDDLPEGVNSNSSLTAQAGSYTSLISESASCEDQLSFEDNKNHDKSTPTHLSRSKSNDTFSKNEEPSNERCTRWTNASGDPPTNMVLGIQNKETERSSPLFYLKPVGNDGQALKGPEGTRLEDEGDVPLDLSSKKYLSMDWKNKEKLSPYVLLQTKELDFDEEDNNGQNMNRDDANMTTLEQCLNLFTEPEVLSQDEAWYCPVCKEHQEATKELSLWRLPHTLIVQLKRFSFRNFIWRDKIDKMVDFPTRGLDLTRYHTGNRSANEPPPIYDLYAVVNHYGGMLGGHYTSFVRCADPGDWKKNELGWRLCDDSHITSSAENNVVTRGAYILFYRRRNMLVPLPPAVSNTLDDDIAEDDDITQRETIVLVHASKVDELPELEITQENFSLSNSDEESVSLLSNQCITEEYTDMDSVD